LDFGKFEFKRRMFAHFVPNKSWSNALMKRVAVPFDKYNDAETFHMMMKETQRDF
jgi:hypothetical protein